MYLLDTNVFIEAHRRYYSFETCPGFWTWLDRARGRGTVASLSPVRDELGGGEDPVAAWAAERAELFPTPDEPTMVSMSRTAQWALAEQTAGRYTDAAVAEYLGCADSFLVAHAHAHGHIIVTNEKPSLGTKRVKIPDAAQALGVTCVDTFALLRKERARFVLSPETES